MYDVKLYYIYEFVLFFISKTENYDLMGRSWMAIDTPAQCTPDCGTQQPPIEINKCNFPKKMVQMECDKLFETTPESPFGVSTSKPFSL